MSRVAKNPITIPDNVDLNINENVVIVKGSKGELDFVLPDTISLDVADKVITIKYDEENQQSVALAGTSRSLINNMVIGVSEGFEKKLELIGVGYRAKAVVLKSHNKQILGQAAAEIRSFRPPEPYKGKGVRYADEHVKRKEAKKAAGAGA